MPNSSNPLSQYFRQPAIYLRLPSQGRFYPKDALEMTATGELPVYPMTALDEITYRTPDALFNGQAVVNVIQSCVPNIKNAWAVPSVDLNAILTSIRIASYGHELTVETECPACKEVDEYGADLRILLDGIRPGDFAKPLQFGELSIMFKPMNYQESNTNNSALFEQQKTIQMVYASDMDENQKMETLNRAMAQITELTMTALKSNIAAVKTPNSIVVEPEYIEEYLRNCDREVFNKIRDHVIELRQSSEIPPMKVQCSSCSHEFEQTLTLDQTSFFVSAS